MRRIGQRSAVSDRSAPAFSLVEMMIAIMILGLGMVMAATVFPVSLDMTKGTLQLNISQTAADVAVATLTVRVPKYAPLNNIPDYDPNGFPLLATPRVALPDMRLIDMHDQTLSLEDQLVLSMPYISLGWPGAVPPPYDLLTALFTERSFWDADYVLPGSTAVVAAQNIRPDLVIIQEVPPNGVASPSGPRLSLVDRVYPPVDLNLIRPADGVLIARTAQDVIAEAVTRRYGWSAIHYRDLNDQTRSGFFCLIVVFYRSNLDGRYLCQDIATVGTGFPAPAAADTLATPDTLFPQAWLASVDVDSTSGLITCSSHVARLLPTGSHVVLAEATYTSPPGAFTKILKNNWDPQSTIATLQFKPGELPMGTGLKVWIFPPAAIRMGSEVQFETVSPVIDVVPKKVIAG